MADHWAQAPVLMAPHILGDDALVDWLVEQQMDEVICAYLPVGPTRSCGASAWAIGRQGHCFAHANERLRSLGMAPRKQGLFPARKAHPRVSGRDATQ